MPLWGGVAVVGVTCVVGDVAFGPSGSLVSACLEGALFGCVVGAWTVAFGCAADGWLGGGWYPGGAVWFSGCVRLRRLGVLVCVELFVAMCVCL